VIHDSWIVDVGSRRSVVHSGGAIQAA